LDEFADDLRHQRLEALVVSILLCVQDAMPVSDPTHVAGLMRTEEIRFLRARRRSEDLFDRAHRVDEPLPTIFFYRGEQRRHFLLLPRVEPGEGLLSLRGE